jgi:hypothetical protein
MKSFIPRESKVKEDTISVRLDCQVIEELKFYSQYLESSQNYVSFRQRCVKQRWGTIQPGRIFAR